MDRDLFLKRVREAAILGRQFPVQIDPNATSDASYVGGGLDLAASFLREWTAVGGQGERVQGDAAALVSIQKVIAGCSARKILCWRHPVLERIGLQSALESQGIQLDWWDDLEKLPPEKRQQISFDAHLGITGVDWAIAETGSLAMIHRSGGRGRSVSLLPPVHIALIEPDQLIPDLFDLYPLLEQLPDGLPSNVTLITGPSKTGDIQLKLTTGVHGPGEVHALILE